MTDDKTMPDNRHTGAKDSGAERGGIVEISAGVVAIADHLREKKDEEGLELFGRLLDRFREQNIEDVAYSMVDMSRYIEMSRDVALGNEPSAAMETLQHDMTDPTNYFNHAIADIEKDLLAGLNSQEVMYRFAKYITYDFSVSQRLIWEVLRQPFDDIGCDLDCGGCADTFKSNAEYALKKLAMYRHNSETPTVPAIAMTYTKVQNGDSAGASIAMQYYKGAVVIESGSILATAMERYLSEHPIDNEAEFESFVVPDELDGYTFDEGSLVRYSVFEFEM